MSFNPQFQAQLASLAKRNAQMLDESQRHAEAVAQTARKQDAIPLDPRLKDPSRYKKYQAVPEVPDIDPYAPTQEFGADVLSNLDMYYNAGRMRDRAERTGRELSPTTPYVNSWQSTYDRTKQERDSYNFNPYAMGYVAPGSKTAAEIFSPEGKARQAELDRTLATIAGKAMVENVAHAQELLQQSGLERAYDILKAMTGYQDWKAAAMESHSTAEVPEAYKEIAAYYSPEAYKSLRRTLEQAGVDVDLLLEYDRREALAPQAAARTARAKAQANNSPFLSTLKTIPVAMLQGVDLAAMATGRGSPQNLATYIPVNQDDMILTNYVSTIRDTVGQDLAKSTKWGNVSSFLYQTGLSMLDSYLQIQLYGPASVYFMGASAAANTTRESLAKGATNSQALLNGLAAGVAETLFEEVSVERLLQPKSISSIRRWVWDSIQQAGVEASEEFFTEIANILTDTVIMGGLSNTEQTIARYMQKGLSRAEAEKRAFLENLSQVGLAAAGGALSGFGMGAMHNALNYADSAKNADDAGSWLLSFTPGEQDQREMIQGLIDSGLESGKKTDSYRLAKVYNAKVERGGTLTPTEIGRLYRANETAIMDEIQSQLKETERVARGEQLLRKMGLTPSQTQTQSKPTSLDTETKAQYTGDTEFSMESAEAAYAEVRLNDRGKKLSETEAKRNAAIVQKVRQGAELEKSEVNALRLANPEMRRVFTELTGITLPTNVDKMLGQPNGLQRVARLIQSEMRAQNAARAQQAQTDAIRNTPDAGDTLRQNAEAAGVAPAPGTPLSDPAQSIRQNAQLSGAAPTRLEDLRVGIQGGRTVGLADWTAAYRSQPGTESDSDEAVRLGFVETAHNQGRINDETYNRLKGEITNGDGVGVRDGLHGESVSDSGESGGGIRAGAEDAEAENGRGSEPVHGRGARGGGSQSQENGRQSLRNEQQSIAEASRREGVDLANAPTIEKRYDRGRITVQQLDDDVFATTTTGQFAIPWFRAIGVEVHGYVGDTIITAEDGTRLRVNGLATPGRLVNIGLTSPERTGLQTARHEGGHCLIKLVPNTFDKANAALTALLDKSEYDELLRLYGLVYGAKYKAALREENPNASDEEIEARLEEMLAEELMCDAYGMITRTIVDNADHVTRVIQTSRYHGAVAPIFDAAWEARRLAVGVDMTPGPNGTVYSIDGIAEAGGFTFEKDGELTVFLDENGNRVEHVTEEMLRRSPLGAVIEACKKAKDPSGQPYMTTDEGQKMYTYFTGLFNLLLETQDIDLIWAVNSTIGFQPVESNEQLRESRKTRVSPNAAITNNSDPQYKKTIDFTTICLKTQAVIDVMSETMKKVGHGLTEDEVIDIVYRNTHNAGEPVPCPVCYVFSRWVGLGGLFDRMLSLQQQYESADTAQIQADIDAIEARVREFARAHDMAEYNKYGKLNSKARDALYKELWPEYDELAYKAYMDRVLQKSTMTAEEQARLDELTPIIRYLDNWTWLTNVRLHPDYKAVPADILLDINAGKVFATEYAVSWKYRTTRGPAMGKAATPYADEHLGQILRGIGASNLSKANIGNLDNNPFNTKSARRGELGKSGMNALQSSWRATMRQNLLNGTRFQSTSDWRFEYALDYLMAFTEMQFLRSKVQLYTKVAEAVHFFASVNAEVNCSLMPKGSGIRILPDGTSELVFSDVTGMHPDDAFRLQDEFDNVQTILVGISDEHIRLALRDPRILFIIPYHASGASEGRYVALMAIVGETVADRDDYSNYQTDHELASPSSDAVRKGHRTDVVSSEQIATRDVRQKLLTGKLAVPTAEEADIVRSHPILNELYKRFYGTDVDGNVSEIDPRYISDELRAKGPCYRDPECFGVTLTSEQAKLVMPYEFWDRTSTIETADENGRAFVEYCESLGLHPRFSGWDAKGKYDPEKDFTNEPGYWKMLGDRRSYNRDGSYHEQLPINVTNADMTYLFREHAIQGITKPSLVNDPSKVEQIATRSAEQVEERRAARRAAIQQAEADAAGLDPKDLRKVYQARGGGQMTEDLDYDEDGSLLDMDEAVDSSDHELSAGQQQYFAQSQARDEDGRLLELYHGTTHYGEITTFRGGKGGWLGPGIYLTSRRSDAQRYADAMGPGNGTVYTMYANATNPLIVTTSNPVQEILREITGSDRAYATRSAKNSNDPSILTKADIKKLQAKGYDSIIWKYANAVEVSVFSPNQVKRMDNLNPTDAGDIRYDLSEADRDAPITAEQQANIDRNNRQTEVGAPLRTLKGSPIRRYQGKVGKFIDNTVYVHKDYAAEVVPQEVLTKAEEILRANYPDFEYRTIAYNTKDGTVRFDEAPDFDNTSERRAAREPIPGEMIKVDPAKGSATPVTQGKDYIWHHKWMWVKNDYKGFDVAESWNWSRQWLNTIRETPDKRSNRGRANGSGHGTANWNKQLEYFGLPIDENSSRYDLSDRTNGVDREGNPYEFVDMPKYQDYTSAETSLPQNTPPVYRGIKWKSGTRNLDIGGGRTEYANQLLGEQGVQNYVLDPYNREADYNLRALDTLMKDGKFDTVTCANVLNVINSAQSRRNVILEAAKALKPDGTAYFQIYEGDGKGEQRETTKGSQENRKTRTYLDEIRQWFEDVEQYEYTGDIKDPNDKKKVIDYGELKKSKSGNIIVARKPKANLPKAYWEYEEGKAVLYDMGEAVEDPTGDDNDYAPPLYSKLEREIAAYKGDKIGAASAVSYLKGHGVKAEEIKWSGIETFLQGKKSVSKQELLDWLKANQLVIVTEERSDSEAEKAAELNEVDSERVDKYRARIKKMRAEFRKLWRDEVHQEFDSEPDDSDPSLWYRSATDALDEYATSLGYSLYGSFPGTLGQMDTLLADIYELLMDIDDIVVKNRAKSRREHAPRWSDYSTGGGWNYREYLYRIPSSTFTTKSMRDHWGTAAKGVLAHARVQDFWTEADPRTGEVFETLFIDEIQSDWHNAGKKHGYLAGGDTERQARIREKQLESDAALRAMGRLDPAYTDIVDRLAKYARQVDTDSSTYWNFITMDDSVRGAIQPPAERQAAFDAALQTLSEDERKTIDAYLAANKAYQDAQRAVDRLHSAADDAPYAKTYQDFVLKNLLRMAAERGYNRLAWTTSEMQLDRWNPFRQSTFELTGEGRKDDVAFQKAYHIEYDQQIPNFLKQFAGQWGAELTEVTLDNTNGVTVPAIEITREMRDSLLYEGQPLYDMSAEVDDPTGDDNDGTNLRLDKATVKKANTTYREEVNSLTYFSGGGLVDKALERSIKRSMGVELDPGPAAIYQLNNGELYIGNVITFSEEELDKYRGKVNYFHASPVCKNYSSINRNRQKARDGDADILTAQATATAIDRLLPKVFTLEQVPGYRNSQALQFILDALERNGYDYDITIARACDYGGATTRKRMLLRAVRDQKLPPLPKKTPGFSWYQATYDQLNDLPVLPDLPEFMKERIANTPKLVDALKNQTKPIIILYGTPGRRVSWAPADVPCPGITTRMSSARVLMPDGTIKEATPQLFARIMGLPDDFKFTEYRGKLNKSQAFKVIGNGVPAQLSQKFFGNLLDDVFHTGVRYSFDIVEDQDGNSRYILSPQMQKWVDLQSKYGVQPEPPGAVRPTEVPKRTKPGNVVSETVPTVMGSAVTPESRLQSIRDAVVDGKLEHIPLHNDVVVRRNERKLEKAIRENPDDPREGWRVTAQAWMRSVDAGRASPDLVAMGAILINHAGNGTASAKEYIDLLTHYAMLAKRAGQTEQAFNIIKKLSPEARLYEAQNYVDRLNEALGEGYDPETGTYNGIQIDPSLIDDYRNAKTDDERDAILDLIAQDVADQIRSKPVDWWTAWRYLCMLGNLRTQVRNISGNALFQPVRIFKDSLAGVIEAGLEKAGVNIERTASVGHDPETWKAAGELFNRYRDIILGGGALKDSADMTIGFARKVESGKHVFDNTGFAAWDKSLGKLFEKYRKGTEWMMDKGDEWFCSFTFRDSLSRFMAANHTTWSKASDELKSKAINKAIQDAAEATYRDNNALARWVSRVARNEDVHPLVRAVAEGLQPFRRTPMNVAIQAWKYSPLGIINSTIDTLKLARKGTLKAKGKDYSKYENITANDIIDSWSKTFTGTGLTILGIVLASMGRLIGAAPKDKKEQELFEQLGYQKYSFVANGRTYTLDWAAPGAIPLFLGANLAQTGLEKGFTLEQLLTAVYQVGDPLIEMSMLQGINDALENAASYGTDSALVTFVTNALWSYISQGLTSTLLGQNKRSFGKNANTRMMTYVDKNQPLPPQLQRVLGKTVAKIPLLDHLGLDYNQIPYIDAWGDMQQTAKNKTWNAIQQHLAPWYTSYPKHEATLDEIDRLYRATGDHSVIFSKAGRDFEVDHATVNLTADQYITYAVTRGQTAKAILAEVISGNGPAHEMYMAMTDKERVDFITEQVYQYANIAGKESCTSYKSDDAWPYDAAAAEQFGVSVAQYLLIYNQLGKIKSDKDAEGNTIDKTRDWKRMAALYEMPGLSESQVKAVAELYGIGKTTRGLSKAEVLTNLDNSPTAESIQEQRTQAASLTESLARTDLWAQATPAQQAKAEEYVHNITSGTKTGQASQRKIDEGAQYGLDTTEYILFKLSLAMNDKPNANGNTGTYDSAEIEAAIRAVPGLSKEERDYLWVSSGRSAKNTPVW